MNKCIICNRDTTKCYELPIIKNLEILYNDGMETSTLGFGAVKTYLCYECGISVSDVLLKNFSRLKEGEYILNLDSENEDLLI